MNSSLQIGDKLSKYIVYCCVGVFAAGITLYVGSYVVSKALERKDAGVSEDGVSDGAFSIGDDGYESGSDEEEEEKGDRSSESCGNGTEASRKEEIGTGTGSILECHEVPDHEENTNWELVNAIFHTLPGDTFEEKIYTGARVNAEEKIPTTAEVTEGNAQTDTFTMTSNEKEKNDFSDIDEPENLKSDKKPEISKKKVPKRNIGYKILGKNKSIKFSVGKETKRDLKSKQNAEDVRKKEESKAKSSFDKIPFNGKKDNLEFNGKKIESENGRPFSEEANDLKPTSISENLSKKKSIGEKKETLKLKTRIDWKNKKIFADELRDSKVKNSNDKKSFTEEPRDSEESDSSSSSSDIHESEMRTVRLNNSSSTEPVINRSLPDLININLNNLSLADINNETEKINNLDFKNIFYDIKRKNLSRSDINENQRQGMKIPNNQKLSFRHYLLQQNHQSYPTQNLLNVDLEEIEDFGNLLPEILNVPQEPENTNFNLDDNSESESDYSSDHEDSFLNEEQMGDIIKKYIDTYLKAILLNEEDLINDLSLDIGALVMQCSSFFDNQMFEIVKLIQCDFVKNFITHPEWKTIYYSREFNQVINEFCQPFDEETHVYEKSWELKDLKIKTVQKMKMLEIKEKCNDGDKISEEQICNVNLFVRNLIYGLYLHATDEKFKKNCDQDNESDLPEKNANLLNERLLNASDFLADEKYLFLMKQLRNNNSDIDDRKNIETEEIHGDNMTAGVSAESPEPLIPRTYSNATTIPADGSKNMNDDDLIESKTLKDLIHGEISKNKKNKKKIRNKKMKRYLSNEDAGYGMETGDDIPVVASD